MSAIELSPVTIEGYVQQVAPKYGLDPAAVLAVAHQEGIGGGIGDKGTSFGPWQLHAGGALPQEEYQGPYSQQTQSWAWSAGGVDYALAQMEHVAGGLQGAAAIEAIVTQFERPAQPAPEIQGAERAYAQYAGGSSPSGSSAQNLSGPTAQLTSFSLPGIASGVASTGLDFFLRLVFVVGALVFGAVALILLVRSFGGPSLPLPPPVQKLTNTVSPPRRKGDAAIRRGDAVTRTSRPQAATRRDRRQAARNVARREQEVREQGGSVSSSDDIPF